VVKKVEDPKVDVSWDESFLTVDLFEEGEHHEYKWPKKISDYINM